MIAEARKRRINKIFELDSHVYAFDSTAIDLYLSVFEWAKFRKHKGGIKLHTLYDVETEEPAFVHITPANIHDSKAMSEIPYKSGACYIFDRGLNDSSNLNTINRIGAFLRCTSQKQMYGSSQNLKTKIAGRCSIKTHLSDLFDKSNSKNVKKRYDSSEPDLFNF